MILFDLSRQCAILLIAVFLLASCSKKTTIVEPIIEPDPELAPAEIIPLPVSNIATEKVFILSEKANIYIAPQNAEMEKIGQYLAGRMNPATGYGMRVLPTTGPPSNGNIHLTTLNGDPALGEEGYQLTITEQLITLEAYQPAGLFRGIQTLRQLLPPSIEQSSVQPGPWGTSTRIIRDYPRFAWRGAMLDVARHFFSVDDVKHYIDLLAFYKINRFHLHLSDDQGWRIMIDSWPNLATHGGSTAVGGGSGGYYTKAEYADLVAYAESRYIVLIPEIDMPGHTNAALASYPDLNCNGVAPPLYTGIDVGFSSLCTTKEITFTFIDDVIKEIAALTTGPYIHVGGDEASVLDIFSYIFFIERVQTIVQSHGKQMIGWEEISQSDLLPTAVTQHWWTNTHAQAASNKGLKIIMSPARRAYMDIKYNSSTPLGLVWPGLIDVEKAYSWDPVTQVPGLSENDILGVEAPLWTETILTMDDIEFMAFPRLPGYAEIGWSPTTDKNWDEYKVRLASHGLRLDAMGVNFYRSPLIPWRETENLENIAYHQYDKL